VYWEEGKLMSTPAPQGRHHGNHRRGGHGTSTSDRQGLAKEWMPERRAYDNLRGPAKISMSSPPHTRLLGGTGNTS
jgi:hypothetical protein